MASTGQLGDAIAVLRGVQLDALTAPTDWAKLIEAELATYAMLSGVDVDLAAERLERFAGVEAGRDHRAIGRRSGRQEPFDLVAAEHAVPLAEDARPFVGPASPLPPSTSQRARGRRG